MQILDQHTQFEKFLEQHTSDEVVGFALSLESCPIARFLRTHGYPQACLSKTRVFAKGLEWWRTEYENELLPLWAIRFIAIVDSTHVTVNAALRTTATAVTASIALRALWRSASYTPGNEPGVGMFEQEIAIAYAIPFSFLGPEPAPMQELVPA